MPRQKKPTRGQGSVFQRGDWWHICYSINGKTYRESAKTKIRDEALALLRRKLGRVASGEQLTPDRVLIRNLLALVINDYELRGKNTYIESLRIRAHIEPALGSVRANQLSSTMIENYIRARLRTSKPSTVNRELALIRRGFVLGERHDPPLVGRVPHFRKLEEDNVRRGFLKPEMYQRLLGELPAELRLLFVFGYNVGLRRGALLGIKWSQVDRKEGVVWLEGRKTKNKKPVPVAVPIYGDMAEYLDRQPKTSEFLFARGSKQILDFRESWRQACERAGIPGLLFHDLRRTAARNLRRAGVQESTAMKITGHKTRSMYERYDIHDLEDTKEAGRKAEEQHKREQKRDAQSPAQIVDRAGDLD